MIREFLDHWKGKKILFLELGVGGMNPMFIQEPFWQMTYQLPFAHSISIHPKGALLPMSLAMQDNERAIHEGIEKVFDGVVHLLKEEKEGAGTDSSEPAGLSAQKQEATDPGEEEQKGCLLFPFQTAGRRRLTGSGRRMALSSVRPAAFP